MKKLFVLLAVVAFIISYGFNVEAQNVKQNEKDKKEQDNKTAKTDAAKIKTADNKTTKSVVVKNQAKDQTVVADKNKVKKTVQARKSNKTDLKVAKSNAPKNLSKLNTEKKANKQVLGCDLAFAKAVTNVAAFFIYINEVSLQYAGRSIAPYSYGEESPGSTEHHTS